MPFFKFRRSDASSAPPAGSTVPVESVEIMRKRARHRLIGASVLVLLGVVGFPMLFDTQPRPVSGDIPIEIPGKNSVKPLTLPAPAVVPAPAAGTVPVPGKTPPSDKVSAAASLAPKEEIFSSKPPKAVVEPAPPAIKKEAKIEPRHEIKPEVKAEAKPEAKPSDKVEVKAEVRPAVKPEVKPAKPAAADSDSVRAMTLLNGSVVPKTPKADAPEAKGRMVVQVGAFADAAKANETRQRLEKSGLPTYTQVVETKDGKRIRVRVGPFASKAEAEKAIGKIRSLNLPVAVLSF